MDLPDNTDVQRVLVRSQLYVITAAISYMCAQYGPLQGSFCVGREQQLSVQGMDLPVWWTG